MNIKIVRQYDSRMKVVGDLTQKNWWLYSQKHRYRISVNDFEFHIEEANRKKLVAVRDNIDPDGISRGINWLFWSDADTCVTNMDIKLESFLENVKPEHHLIFDVSHYGLSTGNFFARNTPLAKELLSAAITCGNVTPEIDARFCKIKGADESTLKLLIESFPNFQRHTTTVKMADFPSTHTKESFILHAAQRSTEERIALLSQYCQ